MHLLLDRSEEAVQVDVQKAKPIGLGRGLGHQRTRIILFAFSLLQKASARNAPCLRAGSGSYCGGELG
jgi:hypothetical protein